MRTFLIACLLSAIISVTYCCNCEYISNGRGYDGCVITVASPPNKYCKCILKNFGRSTCKGVDVGCNSGINCKNPGLTKIHCELGGGNCSGYIA